MPRSVEILYQDYVSHKKAEQKYHGAQNLDVFSLEVGERVLALNHYDGSKWVAGKKIAKTGPLSYKV